MNNILYIIYIYICTTMMIFIIILLSFHTLRGTLGQSFSNSFYLPFDTVLFQS